MPQPTQTALRLGFSINPGPLGEVIPAVVEAERLGFDRVGIWDSPVLCRDVWVTLGAAAAATTRIGLSTWVTNPLTRHPIVTASAAASVAELAPGRMSLGIGSGDSGVYTLGGARASLAGLDDGVLTLRRLLGGDIATDPSATCLAWTPSPVPVLVAAHGERSLRLAARVGDGVIVGLGVSPDVVTRALEIIDEEAAAAGRTVDHRDVWFTAPWVVDPVPGAARRQALWIVTSLAHHVTRSGSKGKLMPPDLADAVVELGRAYDLSTHGSPTPDQIDRYERRAEQLGIADELLARWAIAGTPDDVVAQVGRAAAAGARALDIANDAAPGHVLDRPRAIATHVIPRLVEERPCSTS
jgi:5,10-methylenetetrahydromethanopterin reductase